MKTLIVAEIGVNHNGSEDLARQMIAAAKKCGADAVKFQTFTAEKLVIRGTEKAEYQKLASNDGDQFSMLKNLEMSFDMQRNLFEYCAKLEIEFMSTPFDCDAADFLVDLGMQRIKVSSAEITNHPFLKYLARLDRKMILSTGMASMEEVEQAVQVIKSEKEARGLNSNLMEQLTILHCTSNYPTAYQDVNLKAMCSLHAKFGIDVGYSDHTDGILIAPIAVGLGAKVIEKHFTLDRMLTGPDQKASLEPEGFKQMVDSIRIVDEALGTGDKMPSASELPVRDLVRRSITLKHNKASGEILCENDLIMLRPGMGISPARLHEVVGKKVNVSLDAFSMLNWNDLDD